MSQSQMPPNAQLSAIQGFASQLSGLSSLEERKQTAGLLKTAVDEFVATLNAAQPGEGQAGGAAPIDQSTVPRGGHRDPALGEQPTPPRR